MHGCVGDDCFKLGLQIVLVTLMLVHASSKKMCVLIETSKILLNTQNRQQYGTQITYTEVREIKLW